MIKYNLSCRSKYCNNGNNFEAWFQNIDSYEKQKKSGLIHCPTCGSDEVIKLLTTPNLKKSSNNNMLDNADQKKSADNNLNKNYIAKININNITTLLRTLKKEVQKNSIYVGDEFVNQARLMKQGAIEEKPIYGHGSKKDIEELREDGIDVIDIPWISDDH